jgi:hypothetical protein
MQTERITILASPAAKREMAARASSKGLSLGEYVRRRALDDEELSQEQEAELEALVAEVNSAIPRIQASFGRISETVARLREENDAFFRERSIK